MKGPKSAPLRKSGPEERPVVVIKLLLTRYLPVIQRKLREHVQYVTPRSRSMTESVSHAMTGKVTKKPLTHLL